MDYLRLYIVTYNVATRNPEEDLLELLGLNKDLKPLPDFYLIGLQEVKSQPQNYIIDALFDDPWTNAFRKALIPFGYIKVKTVRLVGLVLSVYCLRKHVIHLRDMQSVSTRTGLMGLWGNKGGISMRLQIYGCSICFVNCHLTPHDNLFQERIADYSAILQHQKFNTREATTILFHDYVFWFGDMNFRIDDIATLGATDIEKLVKKGDLAELLEKDQLRKAMTSGEAFSELVEKDLKFPPTYKFLFNSSNYDIKRRPGWTDRILYKVNSNVYENVVLDAELKSYKSFDNYCVSDHKPVIADFSIKVFSNYVERLVKFLPIQVWYINEINCATCVLGSDVVPTMWDWIGIFEENFTSLDDYHSYIYFPINDEAPSDRIVTQISVPPVKDRYEIKFHEGVIRNPGRFRLIYFSQDSSSVLGMSVVFQAQHRNNEDPGGSYVDW